MMPKLFSSNLFQVIVVLAALLIIAGYSVPIAPFEGTITPQKIMLTILVLLTALWWDFHSDHKEAKMNGG